MQRDAGNLRVNVRLSDARTGAQLWAQRFERPFGELLAIQGEISRSIAEQLPARIGGAERERLAKRYTSSPQAYDYFLRGQALFLVRRTRNNAEARALFAKALELDPKFARAYAALAMTYAMDYRYQTSPEASAPIRRALELATTAQQIDPDIPEVHMVAPTRRAAPDQGAVQRRCANLCRARGTKACAAGGSPASSAATNPGRRGTWSGASRASQAARSASTCARTSLAWTTDTPRASASVAANGKPLAALLGQCDDALAGLEDRALPVSGARFAKARDVARHEVDLEVDARRPSQAPERRDLERVRDQVHFESAGPSRGSR